MTWRVLRRRSLSLVRVLAALCVLSGGLGLLARHGAVTVQQCVAGDGAAGWLGLRLALLRADAACPSGTLAVGGSGGRVMGVVVLVTLPVLVAHLAGLGVGLGALGRLRRALEAARSVLAWVVPHLPASVVPVPSGDDVPPSVAARTVVVLQHTLEAPWRRGPPALRIA
jgi:hypothetical protein